MVEKLSNINHYNLRELTDEKFATIPVHTSLCYQENEDIVSASISLIGDKRRLHFLIFAQTLRFHFHGILCRSD